MADLMNKRLGGFRILADIKGASGSQGQVYKACCEEPPFEGIEVGQVVALKVMPVHDEDGKAWARLLKRTEELVRLSHPNVVKYYGCFSESGPFNDIHVIVQEFLEGETLKQRLEKCPLGLDADEALKVTKGALCGLEYMAENGIVHRDVKPGNIFLCSDGSVKFIDFEIAHKEGGTTTASSNNLIGSFDYMAPDFTDAEFRGDIQSDVFSMGVVMHETITGRTPYKSIEGEDSQANFAFLQRWARLRVDGTSPIQISSRANQLLAHSGAVLAKALAPFSKDRYANFTEFRKGLAEVRYRDLKGSDDVYRILQRVGKGGFGEVFKARSKNTGRLVAIKHLLKAAYAERFYREAKIMAQLRDPCFVQFIGFFVIEHAGSKEAFLVMDFLPGMPGSSLRDAIKRKKGRHLGKREVLLSFARFAHGLAVMHDQGIFHRDIKPSNLYYPEGHPERAAIMDLGIARNIHGTATTGQVPGTLDYMPPEVVLSDNRGDSRMDIYALGLCLYEALTGKMAFPRLPQGTAAYTEFLNRAKTKAKPDISDHAVSSDEALYELVRQMTDPDMSARLSKAADIESRLRELAESVPVTESDQDADEDPVTGETVIVSDDIEKERERIRVRRKMRRLAAVAAAVLAVATCGGLWLMLRGSVVGWLQSRAAETALPEAERVASAYADRGLGAGHHAETEWLKKWAPGQGRWIDLTEETFATCTNKIRAAEVALLDRDAESAANDVVDAYRKGVEKMDACDQQFKSWRKKWATHCSREKIEELAGRIEKERNRRMGRESEYVWQTYMAEGKNIIWDYDGTNTLENCNNKAEEWKKKGEELVVGDPDKEERYRKLKADLESARIKRGQKDAQRDAESELDDVLKAYAESVAAGNEKVEEWRKRWKERLDAERLEEMNVRIVAAQMERAEVEHKQLIEENRRLCEEEQKPIVAGYKDASSKKKDMDDKYAKWVAKWSKASDDLPEDRFKQLKDEVESAKHEREESIKDAALKEKEKARQELQRFIGDYEDPIKDRAESDKKAKQWRKRWKKELDPGAFDELNAQIDSASKKRADIEKWREEQRVLADKTNKVELVCAKLVEAYQSGDGKNKGTIDNRFDEWVKAWEADSVLSNNSLLRNWFAERKRTVKDAQDACEARIAEAKRIQLVVQKTNEVVRVREQLVKGYRDDKSDKAELDRKFTEWMLQWSTNTVLPIGWFPEQRKVVEEEQADRKVREERRQLESRAREGADSVCETYRSDGVAVGDGSRKMWINSWTNTLESAVFTELSEKIGAAREARIRDEEEKVARRKAEEEAARRKAEEDAARSQAEAEAARQKAEQERIQRVSAKTNEVVEVREQLVNGYKDSASDTNKLGKAFSDWTAKWEKDAELPPGWFEAQRFVVETMQKAREERDRLAQQALKLAAERKARIAAKTNEVESVRSELVRDYANDSIEKSKVDDRFGEWTVKWEYDADLQQSLPNWFAELKKTVESAKHAREERVKKRVESKKAEVEAARKELDDGYNSDVSNKAELDKKFEAWVGKWKDDADLPPGWFPVQILAIERAKADRAIRDAQAAAHNEALSETEESKARAERIAREKAEREKAEKEKNWKDAFDHAGRVCKEYESGVEAGETERQLWDGKWKPILDEEAYKKIYAIIDTSRMKAEKKAAEERQKAEAERKKAERARLENDCRRLLGVDWNHVENWRGQLAEVERKVAEGKARGVVDARLETELQDEVDRRKKWVVGIVENRTQQEIEVAGRKIVFGRQEHFELQGGMPEGGLQVQSEGFKPLSIDKAALDGSVVRIGSGKWKLVPVPKIKVSAPTTEPSAGTLNDSEKIKQKIKRCLNEAEIALEDNDGQLFLQRYHDAMKMGYRLTADDKESVKQAFEMCREDKKEKLARAIRDPRFKEEDVRKWWDDVSALYNDLIK